MIGSICNLHCPKVVTWQSK